MSEFIKTLFEEKEKLDEICHIEEQQRKKIQKHLDTLTDDQVREMSFEDKVLLKEKYGFFIDTKLVNLLHREIKNGLIKAKGPAIHYPFLKGLVFLTKEQIYDLDEFVNQMRNLNALTQSLANRKLNDTLKETAEYENIEYKEMTLTDEKWKQIVDLLVQHKIGKCMLHIAVNDCGDTCWIDRKQYEKVKSGKASEDEKEELYDQIWGNTCGYCEISTNCQDLEYCNFMKQTKNLESVVSEDSEILLHNVNKNLYEEYLENPQEEYEIEVVTDSIDSAALKQEKERLLKRIKEIDHVLNCEG